jgi:NADH-quinone oxidoreductase subunit E
MAWITKNSASAKVERRAEPYVTASMRKTLAETYLPRYERPQGALLPALHMVQHEYGWIPPQAMMEIAELLKLKPADVIDTASFYEEYWLKPKGKHLVQVCRSIACEFCGQREVSEACKRALNIDVGETSDDGNFTLVELECLGSCGTAPAMLIDETLYENVDPGRIPEILRNHAANHPPHGHGAHGHADAH